MGTAVFLLFLGALAIRAKKEKEVVGVLQRNVKKKSDTQRVVFLWTKKKELEYFS